MIFKKVTKKKEIIIGIHGFGVAREKEFLNMQKFFIDKNYSFVTFNLFDLNPMDNNWQHWIKRAELFVNKYINEGYTIHLIGFSMGGVIASFIASKYKIQDLVLLSPAFDYIGIDSLKNLAVDFISKPNRKDYFEHRRPPHEYFLTFEQLIRHNRQYIKSVKCPTLIIQGTHDEYVPLKSSRYALRSIPHDNKRLIFIEGGIHEFHVNTDVMHDAFKIVELFLKKEIIYKEKS